VATRDGVLVVRHENEISQTTDVASHAEFRSRRTTRTVDGVQLTGWFTEDFTWEELATLRTRERIPSLRQESARHDGTEPILRLDELLRLVREASAARGRDIGVVLEVKHATHFERSGLDLVPLIERDLRQGGWADGARPLVIESFEPTALVRLRERGIVASYVFLLEAEGRPFDLVVRDGRDAPSYASFLSAEGLDGLAGRFDGISADKRMILAPDAAGRAEGPAPFVAAAKERGLSVYAWTCRPENAFLLRGFRGGGGKAAFGDYAAEWRIIRDAGVDGVFVDHPDLGAEVFRG
jgi:glycerophosphoryl diester phosphodiesterase